MFLVVVFFIFILVNGALGYSELFVSQTSFFGLNENYSVLEVSSNFIYHGIDWLYSSLYSTDIFSFKIYYLWFFNSFLDESLDFFFFFFWYSSLFLSSYQLFYSFFLDFYNSLQLLNLPYFDSWFKFIFSSKEISLLFIFHPELLYVSSNIINNYFFYFSDLYFNLLTNSNGEVFFSPIIVFIQTFFIFFLAGIFITFYFSNYLSYFKDETLVDSDYLLSTSLVESEKELSSIDDIILVVVILIFLFGWYFYVHFLNVLSFVPELVIIFYFLPCLYFIIFGIPTFLMYDFGIFFLVYLRGAGSASSLIYELLFDYIAVVIFYTRILVQGIRLLLMLFTYLSMNDLILFFSFNQSMFLGSEFLWEGGDSAPLTLDNLSYFFFFSLPGKFIYWIYEILHTYFVVTVQFTAFFAIVFWLFLFFYTFFVLEKQENFFSEKRQLRKNYFNYLYNLK